MKGLKINDTEYAVKVSADQPIRRTPVKVYGINQGTALNGRDIEDLIGIKLSFTLRIEPEEGRMPQYQLVYAKLRQTSGPITVSLPYSGSGLTDYVCKVVSFTDEYDGDAGGSAHWKGLTVTLQTVEPVWRA